MTDKSKKSTSILGRIFSPKTFVFTGVSFGIMTMLALPSWGKFKLEIGDFSLSNQDVNFESIWAKMKTEFWTRSDQTLGAIPSLGEVGALGLPDPLKVTEEIEAIEGHEGWEKNHDLNRKLVEVTSSETLSEVGQWEQKQTTAQVEKKVNQSAEDANLASQEVITQNVLKYLARQKAKQAFLLGTMQKYLSDLTLKQDVSNRVLSNISETADKEQLYREQEQQARANTALGLLPYAKLYK